MKTRPEFRSPRTRATAAIALAILLLSTLAAGRAAADRLDEAKDAGYLGEQIDGYLGLVRADAPDWARAVMEEINRKRRERFAEIAARTGATAEQVAAIAGQKAVAREPAGRFVRDASGAWKKK